MSQKDAVETLNVDRLGEIPVSTSRFFGRTLTTMSWATLAVILQVAVSAQAQTYTDLHDFNASAGDPYNFQLTKLAQGRDGNFYGEANSGGTGNGTIAKMTPSGAVSILLSFDGTDGSNPLGGVTLGNDGELYGETWSGGSSGDGIAFKVTTAGVSTALHNFTNTGDGLNPANALVLGTSGMFYGTTNTAPDTIYEVSSAGVFKTLHTLSATDGTSGGQLSQGNDGNFYGGMNMGGTNGYGTLFKMTASGTFTVLHNFSGSDGTIAAPGMVQAASGVLYGAAEQGGAGNAGVVYKTTSAGVFTLLHSLNGTTDGKQPGPLTLATDGNFYGVTVQGGSGSCGTIFKLTTAGVYSVLYNFKNATGCNPAQYIMESTDGLLYGVTQNGGAHGDGSFFSLNVGLKAYITMYPTSGKAGTEVGIIGQGFDSASVVKFGGVAATKVALTGTTYITATVPAGAVDGDVTVATGSTTLTSLKTFIVHNSWSTGAPVPVPVVGPAAAVLSGEIYLVGGYNSTGSLADVQIYNPTTNTWSAGPSLPTATDTGAAAVVSNVLYFIGGSHSGVYTNAVWAYSPATKTWSAKAAMPTGRNGLQVVVEKNIIYAVGGYNGSTFVDNVESHNPKTNEWTEEAPMLGTKDIPAAGLIGTTIVVAGGANVPGSVTGDTEAYDATTNTWRELTADPTARTGPCNGVIGQLYDVGGYINNAGAATTVNESFNLTTDKWTTTLAPMPAGTMFGGSAVVNGQLYCLAGAAVVNSTAVGHVQIYQP